MPPSPDFSGKEFRVTKTAIMEGYIYSDDSLYRTRLFPADTSGLTSFPDYWIAL